MMEFWIPVMIVSVAACIAAATDICMFRVHNYLTFPLILTGLCYHATVGGMGGFTQSVLGAFFGLCILLFPYLLGLMGAGDVKLLAGVGAWLGLPITVVVFVVSSLVAGVYALVLIIMRGKIRQSLFTIKLLVYRIATLGIHLGKEEMVEILAEEPDRRLRVIPFGAMIPLGIAGAIMWLVSMGN